MEARGQELRVRRGRRADVAGVRALLAPGSRRDRFDRRTLTTLTGDVYVAEDAHGAIVGVVSVAYVRSLSEGRFAAVLDGARAAGDAAPVLDRLLAVAEGRARQRGCRRLAAWGTGDPALHAALVARGYRPGEMLVVELGDAG